MSRSSMQRLRVLVSATVLAGTFGFGCGGGSASTDAFRAARALTSEIAEVDLRAEELTRQLTAALTDEAASPEAALDRLDTFVAANIDEMNEVAAVIAARVAQLEGPELRAYLEVMAERMSEPTFAWRDAYFAFIEDNPALEARLREVTAPLGEQIAPVERPF